MKNKIIRKVTNALYTRLRRSKLAVFFFPISVRKDLQALDKEECDYYSEKIFHVLLVMLLILLVIFCGIFRAYRISTCPINVIERPKVDEEKRDVELRVGSGDVFGLKVSPRILTKEEAEVAFSEFLPKLEQYILGNNQDAMSVIENLLLIEHLPGYPFSIYWESSAEQIIDNAGTVYREYLAKDTLVTITAICTYLEYQWESQICVNVLQEALTEEERYKRDLSLLLSEAEEKQQYSDVLQLPEEFAGQPIVYRGVMKWDKFVILGVLLCVTGVLLWCGGDQDLRKERKKRQIGFEEQYLNLVSRLSLYLFAGVNVQTAMRYCVKDYVNKPTGGEGLREALLHFDKDLVNGYSFQRALDVFAERADHIYYKRLAGLLQQGVANGTSSLARMLQEEVEKIREDKRRQCKVKGEKMSSALIAPMLLQLCVVIALMMLPAFSNMQF